MNAKRPVATYPFSQAQLWQRCLDLQTVLTRDAALLAALGISLAMQTRFKKDTDLFGAMDPDTVLVQEGAVATEDKSAEEATLETAIQAVMSRVGLKDAPTTAAYKRFGAAHISTLSDAALHLAGTMVVKQGTKYLADYQAQGLTQAMLDAVAAANLAFVASLTDQHDAGSARATATDARIQFANGLYQQAVAIGAAGVAQWRFTNAAKAAEYVLDPASHPDAVSLPPKSATKQ